MDATRFDDLSRAVSASVSRRGLLAGLSLGLVAGLPFALGDEAAAKKKRKKKKKKKRKKSPPPPICQSVVCPLCQTCDPVTGQCEIQPSLNGQPGQACAAPRVCCSGSCCDPLHACNGAGECATCAEVCPDICGICITLADGGTACGDIVSAACAEACATTTACPIGKECATSFTQRIDNVTTHLCGLPVGAGLCVTITPCS